MQLLAARFAKSRLATITIYLALAGLAAPLLVAQEAPQGQGQQEGARMRGMFGPGMNGSGGTVTAINGDEITVKNEQGEVYKVETGANTHFRKDRAEAKITDIKVGDDIMAAGNLDEQAKTIGAVFVVVLDPEQAARMKEMRANFGKTWTMGRVTAVNTDGLTLTVERPDKMSQMITVDENTTFRKGGRGNAEDITFPDIKVGDMVRANGSMHGANFLATDLTVMGPGGARAGRFGPGNGGDQSTAPAGSNTPTGGSTPAQPASPQN